MRRLFSTFAPGWPGAGLLLLRVAGGLLTISYGVKGLSAGPAAAAAAMDAAAIAAGLLLCAGLWTPLAGLLVAAIALWHAISQSGDPSAFILLGTIGLALALLGPGCWSVDARLFGWKRIDIHGPGDGFLTL